MTFLEAALEILKREGRPLHFKELTERAMSKKLLTFVGRTPELTMQTQLTAVVKKSPGNPFVRVKPGVFGLLRYPEMPPEAATDEDSSESKDANDGAAPRSPEDGGEKRRRRGESSEPRAEGEDRDGRGRRRRRRGGRGRGRGEEEATTSASESDSESGEGAEEPSVGGLSAEARAAALAETGVLEGDDEMSAMDDDALDDDGSDLGSSPESDGGDPASSGRDERATSGGRSMAGGDDQLRAGEGGGQTVGGEGRDDASEQLGADDDDQDDGDDDEPSAEGGAFGSAEGASGAPGDELGGRRRRRRRRRRRGGEGGFAPEARGTGFSGEETARPTESAASAGPPGGSPMGAEGDSAGSGEAGAPADIGDGAPGSVRRILTPVDAAVDVLRGQAPGRGVHVRQIADTAVRRRLIHGEPNEAWRVIRTALAAEPKERLRSGLRPRIRSAGSGLFALARRPPDGELEKAEQIFGEARRALRERTMAALERRLAELPPGAFEALARVLLQREGFGPTTFVKRVEGTIYVEALRGRGSRPSKCLVALRPGGTSVGRRAIGELRAGIRARGQDEGLLMLAGRLSDEALAEWRQAGPPLEIADGAALAETCVRHGVGVLGATVQVDFIDGDFFAELAEG